MNGFGLALITIFCTPLGWIGMTVAGVIVYAIAK